MKALVASLIVLALFGSAEAGKIKRNPAVGRAFQKAHPCPSTGKTYGKCPGYVKDHIKPLYKGGRDSVENLQWQSVRDAKIKDRWE